ncbi:MAG: bifunctional precorrin-2 dehydrogenase/sirohydrochlorin ferrochelatase [Sphingomonadaceae bacterium]|nr:bifunctional precorrin-2 dehydrogenase/sirohydrochlorin ferrochelatase [Sphingomonadaceae bacterium]
MHSLPLFVRLEGRPVILLGKGEAAAAKRRLLERAGAKIVEESEAAALVIIAIEDDDEARAAAERLRARGILVNAVDRPALCDFTIPAIVDRDPVLIAIGTNGASAGLAKALRQRFERLLPGRLGEVAERLSATRDAIRKKWPESADRRRAIDSALDEGGPLDPFGPVKEEMVDCWLASDAGRTKAGHVELATIQLRSTNPDDLTVGETLVLGRADRVYLAPGVPEAIAHRARADAERIEADAPPEDPPPGLSVFVAAK